MLAASHDPNRTGATTKRGVVLVDDHAIYRRGLAAVIHETDDFEVVGEAANAADALSLLRRVPAKVAIIDISLPGTNGLELLKHLRAEHPDLRVLILSAHDEKIYAVRCLQAGAAGYLMKSDVANQLPENLRKIVHGGVLVSPKFGEELIYKISQETPGQGQSVLDRLTDRELEVLNLVGKGRSSREIASLLHLSVKTIESHRLHIKEKLSFADASHLVRFATDWVASQFNTAEPPPAS